jgi:hypothetical protein
MILRFEPSSGDPRLLARCDTESMDGLGVTTGGCGVFGVGRVRCGLGVNYVGCGCQPLFDNF